jgi:hypothetical protein
LTDKPTHKVRCRVAAIDVYDDTDADVWLVPLSDDVTLVDTYDAEWVDRDQDRCTEWEVEGSAKRGYWSARSFDVGVKYAQTEHVDGAVLYAPRTPIYDYEEIASDLRACAVEHDAYVVAHLKCERVRELYEYGRVKFEYHGRCVRVDIVRREEAQDD